MNEQNDKENINLLRSARESLNLTLLQVSEMTKIRPHILEEIESGNYKVLPLPYLLASVKTYAKALRLPQEEIDSLVNYIKARSGVKEEPVYKTPPKSEKINITDKSHRLKFGKYEINFTTSNLINYLIYTALGLTIIVLIYVTFFMDEGEVRTFSGELEKKPDTTVIEDINDGLEAFFAVKDSIVLEAYGIDTAWMKIVVDGKKAEQITFYPETERRWAAKDYFILSIGNEGAIKFVRDGEELPRFGKKGTVIRNIKITRDEIKISSKPWGSDSTRKKRKRKKKNDKKDDIRFLEPSNVKPLTPKIKKN
jgi:transcriptional regulator with XRE-family HTH domain